MKNSSEAVALITGASSGIGLELAKLFAANNYHLIIISDNRAKLEAAAKELSGARHIDIIEADLSHPEGPVKVYNEVYQLGLHPDVLVNNAGVGVYGDFARDTSLEEEMAMIQLNVNAVVHMTKLFVPDMVKRGSGRVLITASIASLTSTPMAAVYGATKAFDYAFAQGLRDELKETGVTVTALLPGPTDTNWFDRAGAGDTKIANGNLADPAVVAKAGYDALMSGDDHVVAPFKDKVQAVLSHVMPDSILAHNARIE